MKNTSGPVCISGAVANSTIAVASILSNASKDAAFVYDFTTTGATIVTTPTSATSYNPADYGVYALYPPLHPLLSLILLVMIVWALFGNGCLLYLVCTEKNMREPGNIFLCGLALTDIAQILVYAPTAVYSVEHGEFPGEDWCRVQAFLVPFLGTLSLYLQASLWICRFIYLAYPLQYASMMTKRRVAVTMVVCLLVSLTAPLVQLARVGTIRTWTADLVSVDIAEPVSLMVPCTMGSPEIMVNFGLSSVALGVSFVVCILVNREVMGSLDRHAELTGIVKDQREQKMKATKTLTVIFIVQMLTWSPGITVGILAWAGIIAPGLPINDVVFVLMMTSTFTDSIVFAKRKGIYRRAVTKIYGKMTKRYQRDAGLDDIPMRTLRVENT